MKHRRADPDKGHRQQDEQENAGKGQKQQACQREAHANDESVRSWMSVGEIADHWLEQGSGDLVGQRDGSNLHEAQPQRFLDDRVDGGYHRLEHIVQQVTHAHHEQYRQRGLFLQVVHLMKCG